MSLQSAVFASNRHVAQPPSPIRNRRGYLELPLRRLKAVGALDVQHEDAIRALASERRKLAKGDTLIPAASGPHFVLEGWACQARILAPSRRQIFSVVLPGDLIGQLPGDSDSDAAFDYQALTQVTVIDAAALLIHPAISSAMNALRDRARARLFDHMVRLGAYTAYESMAHLFLELHQRQAQIGLAEGGRFPFPVGQERLGEILGLSGVHVNRTLAKLKQDGHLLAGPGWYALPRLQELSAQMNYPLPA